MGNCEQHLVIHDGETGKSVETVSTPAMWGMADEMKDFVRMSKPGHSESFYALVFVRLLWMVAAKREGMQVDMPADLSDGSALYDSTISYIDRFDTTVIEDEKPADDGGNPSKAARGAIRGAKRAG